MTSTNKRKHIQLDMPFGTANNKLKKMILFKLLQEAKLNVCFQCGKKIEIIEELSIEHKIPWLDSKNPKELFWDLDNIAFSHLSCNISAGRRKETKHPSIWSYHKGCRCPECTELKKLELRRYRSII